MAAERVRLPAELPFDFRALERVAMSACGTAYYAGLVAKYWFERFARLPAEIDVCFRAPLPRGAAVAGWTVDFRVAVG
jgi:glutamine---fructose-6-phosphate transaminase (isomerizing)